MKSQFKAAFDQCDMYVLLPSCISHGEEHHIPLCESGTHGPTSSSYTLALIMQCLQCSIVSNQGRGRWNFCVHCSTDELVKLIGLHREGYDRGRVTGPWKWRKMYMASNISRWLQCNLKSLGWIIPCDMGALLATFSAVRSAPTVLIPTQLKAVHTLTLMAREKNHLIRSSCKHIRCTCKNTRSSCKMIRCTCKYTRLWC